MKESEATQKWCPFSRQILMQKPTQAIGAMQFLPVAAHNRTQNISTGQMSGVTPCIGSNCAVWVAEPQALQAKGVTNIRDGLDLEKHGHCGLVR